MGKVGRPTCKCAGNVYNDLIEAAEKCFSSTPYHAVGIRQIAKEAGTNSAMIHHYFGSKVGLYKKLLEKHFNPMIEALQNIESSESSDPVEVQLRNVTSMFAENRWLVRVFLHEILNESAPLREYFITKLIRPMRNTFLKQINKKIESGMYKEDLDPLLTMMSVMSMAVFPHIIMDVLESDPEVKVEKELIDKLMKHNLVMFNKAYKKEGI
ncbi:TetR/AcrR family transcriptional regulator [bacterium]|nr:TetR/AcrR family transcriptional regulator [bacterium]